MAGEGNDLLDELEFRSQFSRGRSVTRPRDLLHGKDQSSSASASASARATSAARSMRASSEDETEMVTTKRTVRATSVFPADLRHFENLDNVEEELSRFGYGVSNEGLHRARRALSEARVILTGIKRSSESMARESSSYESMERSRSKMSSMLKSSSLSEESGMTGNYKITITPRATAWSDYTPGLHAAWDSRAVTANLLSKYTAGQYPGFKFGGKGMSLDFEDNIGSSLDSSQFKSRRSAAKSKDYSNFETATESYLNGLARAYGLDEESKRRAQLRASTTTRDLDLGYTSRASSAREYFSLGDARDYLTNLGETFDTYRPSIARDMLTFDRASASASVARDYSIGESFERASMARDLRNKSTARESLESSFKSSNFESDAAKSSSVRNLRGRSKSHLENFGTTATESYLDGMAKAYGVKFDGTSRSSARTAADMESSGFGLGRQSMVRSVRADSFEPDESAQAYLAKYGVNLEDKAKRYFEDDESLSIKGRSNRADVYATQVIGGFTGRAASSARERIF